MPYDNYGGMPPHENTPTSRKAARAVRPRMESRLRRAWNALQEAGPEGLTSDELEAKLGMCHQTGSARVRDLVLMGLVRNTGLERRTRQGEMAAVMAVCPGSKLEDGLARKKTAPVFYLIAGPRTGEEVAVSWWKPDQMGYTSLVREAGRYSAEEAYQIMRRGRGDLAIPEKEALALVTDIVPVFSTPAIEACSADFMMRIARREIP